MRAMILLGINGGFGNADCGHLAAPGGRPVSRVSGRLGPRRDRPHNLCGTGGVATAAARPGAGARTPAQHRAGRCPPGSTPCPTKKAPPPTLIATWNWPASSARRFAPLVCPLGPARTAWTS
jgi:hypothetical protein